jgi:hypothetical protein
MRQRRHERHLIVPSFHGKGEGLHNRRTSTKQAALSTMKHTPMSS